jgi:glutaredoxin
MRHVLLYTKPGCHLCDEALKLLLSLGEALGQPLEVEEINILEDSALYARYRYRIPVIVIDPGQEGATLYAPVRPSDLRAALVRR